MSKETEKPAGNTHKISGKSRNYHNHLNTSTRNDKVRRS